MNRRTLSITDHGKIIQKLKEQDRFKKVRFSIAYLPQCRKYDLKAAIGPMGVNEISQRGAVPQRGPFYNSAMIYLVLTDLARKLDDA